MRYLVICPDWYLYISWTNIFITPLGVVLAPSFSLLSRSGSMWGQVGATEHVFQWPIYIVFKLSTKYSNFEIHGQIMHIKS
jgi:hypothetical protein